MKLSEYKDKTVKLREFSKEVDNQRYELELRTLRGLFKKLNKDKTVKKIEQLFETAMDVVNGLKDGSLFKGDHEANILRIFEKHRPTPESFEERYRREWIEGAYSVKNRETGDWSVFSERDHIDMVGLDGVPILINKNPNFRNGNKL